MGIRSKVRKTFRNGHNGINSRVQFHHAWNTACVIWIDNEWRLFFAELAVVQRISPTSRSLHTAYVNNTVKSWTLIDPPSLANQPASVDKLYTHLMLCPNTRTGWTTHVTIVHLLVPFQPFIQIVISYYNGYTITQCAGIMQVVQ